MIDNSGISLLRCFGTHWKRDGVVWASAPKILGKLVTEASPVDFHDQVGLYILYDRHDLIYVGRSDKKTPLGARLYEHTKDHLSGQWDRFSWFGFAAVYEAGQREAVPGENSLDAIIGTIEAIIVENFRPWQNRVGAKEMSTEYIQARGGQ
jgi:hypothetical protein